MSDEKEQGYADELLGRAVKAAEAFEAFTQDAVDRIVEAVYRAAFNARISLAEAACEETLLGNLKDKVQKNTMASLVLYRDIRKEKTVGIIHEDTVRGITEIAQPLGPVLGLTPVTNPTSTVINDILICLKTRNPVILCPHKAAKKCSRKTAEILYEAALKAGAPVDCVQWTLKSKWGYTAALMQHPKVALILATTAFHFVKEAYKSGNPVLGAGEGNVPVFIDPSADLGLTARSLVASKTYDYGTVCCSEQALVVLEEMDPAVRQALEGEGAHFCTEEETEKLGQAAFDPDRRLMRSDVVGQPAEKIAKRAGIEVPEGTRLLLAPLNRVGPEEPLSHEILAPILAYYPTSDLEEAIKTCQAVNRFHGRGHTFSFYGDNRQNLERFALRLKAGRVLINTPSSLGGLGGTFNRLNPSLTLSCGTAGKNFLSENITVRHLLNINRVAPWNPDKAWIQIPEEAWLDPAFDAAALDKLTGNPEP